MTSRPGRAMVTTAQEAAMDLHDLTHDELDVLGADVEDYPSRGNKDAKVDALRAAGVEAPAAAADADTDADGPVAPTAEPDERAEVVREQVNAGQTGLDPVLAAEREARRKAEADFRPPRATDRTVDVVDPDGRLERDRTKAREIEGQKQDVREGPVEA